jgi:predicted transcriptional regulator
MKEPRLSKAETRILEQYWKLGTASVREILESLPEDERVAYTTVQTPCLLTRGGGCVTEDQDDRQWPAFSADH